MIHKFHFFAPRLFREVELLPRLHLSGPAIQSPLEMRAKRRREEGKLQDVQPAQILECRLHSTSYACNGVAPCRKSRRGGGGAKPSKRQKGKMKAICFPLRILTLFSSFSRILRRSIAVGCEGGVPFSRPSKLQPGCFPNTTNMRRSDARPAR